MNAAEYVSAESLQARFDFIRQSPRESSTVDMIVTRPAEGVRETPAEARLDVVEGLLGDSWLARGSSRTPDKRANPNAQITIMNSRAIAAVAGSKDRWPLAGDQIFVDLDLSTDNLPAGSRLQIGDAVIEITADPHTGCAKFKARFGEDALAFVNSIEGRALRLRGANAKIITGGLVRVGDPVVRI
jgi:MOSC domain-containing protein YiiM